MSAFCFKPSFCKRMAKPSLWIGWAFLGIFQFGARCQTEQDPWAGTEHFQKTTASPKPFLASLPTFLNGSYAFVPAMTHGYLGFCGATPSPLGTPLEKWKALFSRGGELSPQWQHALTFADVEKRLVIDVRSDSFDHRSLARPFLFQIQAQAATGGMMSHYEWLPLAAPFANFPHSLAGFRESLAPSLSLVWKPVSPEGGVKGQLCGAEKTSDCLEVHYSEKRSTLVLNLGKTSWCPPDVDFFWPLVKLNETTLSELQRILRARLLSNLQKEQAGQLGLKAFVTHFHPDRMATPSSWSGIIAEALSDSPLGFLEQFGSVTLKHNGDSVNITNTQFKAAQSSTDTAGQQPAKALLEATWAHVESRTPVLANQAFLDRVSWEASQAPGNLVLEIQADFSLWKALDQVRQEKVFDIP